MPHTGGFGRLRAGRSSWKVVGALWAALVVLLQWYPFDFVFSPALIRWRLGTLLMPLRGYYFSDPFSALARACSIVLLALPLGALLQVAWDGTAGDGRVVRSAWRAPVAVFGLFLVIELGQVLLPGRFPDLADVLLSGASAAVGMLGIRLWPDSMNPTAPISR